MLKCWVSHLELYTEDNLGIIKDQGKYYKVTIVRVLGMERLRMGVNILRAQNFVFHWYQRVDLR